MKRLLPLALLLLACSGPTAAPAADAPAPGSADVVGVEVTGPAGGYTFSVRVRSPDTGCDRYADWWEVVAEDGTLAYRRILLHSHVGEQPFTRSGGPVPVAETQVVWVRAHLSTGGYGRAMRGSASAGFGADAPPAGFAAALESAPPQPDNCAF